MTLIVAQSPNVAPAASARPKLLVLASTFPRWQGDVTPPFVLDLCRELAGSFEVHVLAPHARGAQTTEVVDGVNVRRFRYLPEVWQTLAYDGGIPERLRREPLALLQVPFFLFAQFCAALRLVWTLRPNVIHAHWVLPQGILALLVSWLCPGRPPVVCTLHGSDVHGLNTRPLRWIRMLTLRRVALVTIVSESLRMPVLGQGVAPDRVHLAPMGVETETLFRPSDAAERPCGVVVFAGRLVAGKGVDVLLRAWAQLPAVQDTAHLLLVGDGPARPALQAQALALGLGNRVHFTGAVPPPAVADRFRSATVAVFPFTGAEGLGLVVAEAQACGCPVIASDIPAVRDTVRPEVTGIVVPPGDVEALARAMQRVLSDPVLALRLARAGRASALEKYSWKVAGARYRDLLRSLAGPS